MADCTIAMECLMERRAQSCCALSLVTIYYLENNEIKRVIVVQYGNWPLPNDPAWSL